MTFPGEALMMIVMSENARNKWRILGELMRIVQGGTEWSVNIGAAHRAFFKAYFSAREC